MIIYERRLRGIAPALRHTRASKGYSAGQFVTRSQLRCTMQRSNYMSITHMPDIINCFTRPDN